MTLDPEGSFDKLIKIFIVGHRLTVLIGTRMVPNWKEIFDVTDVDSWGPSFI